MKNFKPATFFARCSARRFSRGIIIFSLVSPLALMASAQVNSLEFKLLDGSAISISSKNLEMTFTESSLIASDGSTELEIPLNQLYKFYFSDALTSIESIMTAGSGYSAVDLGGVNYGEYDSLEDMKTNLPAGVYVINNGSETFKVIVK
ncbi:MAG: hypothetical protein K2M31_07400 [Muribaculaceae bacterium]|nr:hypothetical protein [Muribaculaceae bacterium]